MSIASGSRRGDRIIAHAWRDGKLLASDLPLGDWRIQWDGSRQVQAQGSFDIIDTSGELSPWAADDALGVGGSKLQVTYMVGGREPVNLGWYRIVATAPEESWRIYPTNEGTRWISGGASIPVDADDLTRTSALDEFLTPESPAAGATAVSEVRRLLADTIPVKLASGVTDVTVPTGVVYDTHRMDAVEDLLTLINCTHRMDGDGVMEILPKTVTPSVWTVQGGDGGALVKVQREQRLDLLRNGIVVRGQTANGDPVQGVALEASGPLQWGGPAGRLPETVSDSLITSTPQAQAAAERRLQGEVTSRSLPIIITCLPNPAIQVGDYVQVLAPHRNGGTAPLNAQVVGVTLRQTAGAPQPMTLNAVVSYAEMQSIARRVV